MELFPFVESGTPLLVSASENGLFLHPVRNERFGHPFLLCSGYKSGLSGCVYNNSLYYTYINKENSLLLRRLRESSLLFRLDSTDDVSYRDPRLIVFRNTLFLFYLEETKGSYRLKLCLPFSEAELQLPDLLRTACSEPPLLLLQTAGQYLYLFLTAKDSCVSYRYSPDTFELLRPEEELHSELQSSWNTEKAQLEHNLQTTLTQLAECNQNRLRLTHELDLSAHLLERAKSQYSELMRVAEQYKQEAAKWYGKYTDRN